MRPHDWPERMLDVVDRHRAHEFAWGLYDCGTLLRDCAAAIGAADPLAAFGTWDSELTALLRLRRCNVTSIRDHMMATCSRVPPGEAMRGDVGYAGVWGPISCPAIVVGAEAVSRDQDGWVVIDASSLTEVYRL